MEERTARSRGYLVAARFRVTYWNPKGAVYDPISRAFQMSLPALALDARANLRERQPRTAREQTGNLSKSIRSVTLSKYKGKIVARTKYAASQELGSRAHEIKARRKPNLVFPWEGSVDMVNGGSLDSSRMFIGPRVFHPGTEGLHFLWDAAQRLEERMKIFGRMVFR